MKQLIFHNDTIHLYIIAALLIYAMYTDIKTLEVPLWVSFTGFIIQTIHYILNFNVHYITLGIFTGILIFALSKTCMKYGGLGGADVLLSSLIGYSVPYHAFQILIIAYISSIPISLYLYLKKEEKEYPFVPFITLSFLLIFYMNYN